MKKLIFYLIIILSIQVNSYATNPVRETAVYNNIKYTGCYKRIFYGYLTKKNLDINYVPRIFKDKGHYNCSSACQDFAIDIYIENDSLFITKVYNCDKTYSLDLENEFPDITKNNKIYANWFTGRLSLGQGKIVNRTFINTYENEIILYVEDGQIISEYEIINISQYYLINKMRLIAFSNSNFNYKSARGNKRNLIDCTKIIHSNETLQIRIEAYRQKENDSITIMKLFKKKPFTIIRFCERDALSYTEIKKEKVIHEKILVFNNGYYYVIEFKYDNTIVNKSIRQSFIDTIIFAKIK